MPNAPRSILVRTEYLLVAIFAVLFAVWGISKCGKRSTDYDVPVATTPAPTVPVQRDAVAAAPSPKRVAAPVNSPKETSATMANPTVATPKAPAPKAATPKTAAPAEKYTKLFVSVEGLKVRKKPNQQAGILGKLKANEELSFLGDRTKTTEKIAMPNGSVADEPWVWVKTKSGVVGWVYGGGVRYYK